MSNTIEVRIPDLGDFSDIPVIEIPVAVGDTVAQDDTLIVLESDKATLDVPSPASGRVAALKVAVDDSVSQGTVIALIEADQTAPDVSATSEPPAVSHAVADTAQAQQATPSQTTSANASPPAPAANNVLPTPDRTGVPAYATPSIRRFARQLGVDIDDVRGSGPKNRILREDVEAFVKDRMTGSAANTATMTSAGLPPWPQVDFASFGPVERVPLSRITRISGPALARNATVIPHVTTFEKSDVTELEDFRKLMNAEAQADDAKISMLAFALKAVVSALKAFPVFNASLVGDELVVKNYWNIGFAANTEDGLVVPVIKQADVKGVREIANEMSALAAMARDGKLKSTDMQGSTFTISSLGGVGSTAFTPIINAPEVAILGISRSEIQPVWNDSAFEPRLILPLSLSFDHRVIDGVAAARFVLHIASILSDFRRLAN